MSTENIRRLLTVQQAATFLNLSHRHLYNRIAPGAENPFPVRPIRIGKSVRFDLKDLEIFVENLKTRNPEAKADINHKVLKNDASMKEVKRCDANGHGQNCS